MNYTLLIHSPKKVLFRDGTQAEEYYFHIHTKHLMNYAEYFQVCKKVDKNLFTNGMNYYTMDWSSVITTDGMTLAQVVREMYRELLDGDDDHEFTKEYSSWSGSLKKTNLYLNFRLRQII